MEENRLHLVRVWLVGDRVEIYKIVPDQRNINYIKHSEYTSFRFFCDGLMKRLILKLLHPADSDFLPMNTIIDDFLIEDINFDVIELLAAADIIKNEDFRGKVKGYLAGDIELEELHKEVVAYHMVEKLSQ